MDAPLPGETAKRPGGARLNRGWPAGDAAARPGGRGTDTPKPGAPPGGGRSFGGGFPRLLFQLVIGRGYRKTGRGPEEDEGLGVSLAQLVDQPFECRQRPLGGVGVARAQPCGQGEAVPAVENGERLIPVPFVMAVEEAELGPGVRWPTAGLRDLCSSHNP